MTGPEHGQDDSAHLRRTLDAMVEQEQELERLKDRLVPGRTMGDVAREDLERLGLLVDDEVGQRRRRLLDGMRGAQRTAFAAATAERLLGAHERLPPTRQPPYTLGWRPLLDAVWRGLAGDHQAFYDVSAAVAIFHLSPQHHIEGPEGPDEADDDAVAAVLFTALSFLYGCADFAEWTAGRGTDAAFWLAEDDRAWRARRPPEVSILGWEQAHPAYQGELARQLHDLGMLAERDEVLRRDLGPEDDAAAAELLRRLGRR